MSYRESDILYEKGEYWVLQKPKWVEVYKIGATHSTRVSTFDHRSEPSKNLERAKADIDRRIAIDEKVN